MSTDRRESPRVTPERPLHARAEGVDADLTLLDVSLGGFLIEGPVAFSRGASHRFRISAPTGGRVIELRAQAVRCRLRSARPIPIYQTGFAFLNHRHPSSVARVQALIESLTVQPVE
jgi:hypothetical protein